jgi:hypothetical protein
MAISIKDVRKGSRVQLRNGWEADVADNMVNSQTRMCTVYGDYTEMGSVYSTDIVSARMADGTWQFVQHTPRALAIHKARTAWGF